MLGPSKRYWVSGMTASVNRRLSVSGRQDAPGAASAAVGRATPAVAAAPSSAVARRKLRLAAPACAASA